MIRFQNAKLVSILKKYPLHMVLLVVFFILHTNNLYAGLVPGKDILLAFIYTSCGVLLTFGVFYLILRNLINAGIATTIFGILFLYFGLLKNGLAQSSLPSVLSSYKILLPVLLFLFLLLLYRLKKNPRSPRLNLFLNLLLLIYIGIEVVEAISKREVNKLVAVDTDSGKKPDTGNLPDIIYILADCYPSSSYQQEILGAAANELDSLLTGKGFFVVSGSTSNYRFTPFSMASVFNMSYLPGLVSMQPAKPLQYNKALKWVENAQVFNTLKSNNYALYNLSIFDMPGIPAIKKEHFLSTTGMNLLFYNTLYSCIYREVAPALFPVMRTRFIERTQKMNRLQREGFRNYNRQLIDSLAGIGPDQPGKPHRFIYAHLMMPHFPYFFDSTGHAYPDEAVFGPEMITSKNRFKNYISYTNKQLDALIQKLQEKYNRKAIIILQSDHALDDIPGSQRKDAFRNYTAYFFPDGDYSSLRDNLSNVNTFRIVFNKYFGQQLPLLADSSIYNQ